MQELDPNHQGDVNEEEFLLILKFIQQRAKQATNLPQLPPPQNGSIDSIQNSVIS
jgi:hypothetical protein